MGRIVDILVRDLQGLLHDLGRDGGAIGPSVYDTAMVARLAPPREGPDPALEWLLSRQQSDGGWCSPRYPIGRDLPTLAAVLALREQRKDAKAREACAAGLAFLRQQAGQWTAIPDDLPIALELTLPVLVQEAIRLGVDISPEPYRLLAAEGERKRKYILRGPVVRGTPPAYAWEGLGVPPTADLVDTVAGAGASPAATAVWIAAARGDATLASSCLSAAAYLEKAAASTRSGVPGVVPLLFPAERFEQAFSLLALVAAGLGTSPSFAVPLSAAVDDLSSAMRPEGIGLADVFMVDGDDTFVSVAVLKAAGRAVDIGLVRRFEGEDRFFVYPGERNPSPSANAHALYALSFFGEDSPAARAYLLSRQSPDGRFTGDKWHASWLYTTYRAVLALRGAQESHALRSAAAALSSYQHQDGGFGASSDSTEPETAHGLLALRALRDKGVSGPDCRERMERAYRFLLSRYRPFTWAGEPLWIGKELYAAPRIDKAVALSAMLSTAVELEE